MKEAERVGDHAVHCRHIEVDGFPMYQIRLVPVTKKWDDGIVLASINAAVLKHADGFEQQVTQACLHAVAEFYRARGRDIQRWVDVARSESC